MKLFVVPNTLTKLQNARKTNITVIYSRPDLGFGTPTLPTSFFTRTCNNINRQILYHKTMTITSVQGLNRWWKETHFSSQAVYIIVDTGYISIWWNNAICNLIKLECTALSYTSKFFDEGVHKGKIIRNVTFTTTTNSFVLFYFNR